MQFGPAPRRARSENIVPMINIVFLLLVFFLLTATIAPPEPVTVDLPETATAAEPPAPPGDGLFVTADGTPFFGSLRGDAAIAQAAAGRSRDGQEPPLTIHADAAMDGAAFATLLSRLAQAGITEVTLAVTHP